MGATPRLPTPMKSSPPVYLLVLLALLTTGIPALSAAAVDAKCDAASASKITPSQLLAKQYDMFDFPSSLFEFGGHTKIQYKISTGTVPLKLLDDRGAPKETVATADACLNYKFDYTNKMGKYDVLSNHFYFRYRLCSPEESWTGGCKVGDTCMFFGASGAEKVECNKKPATPSDVTELCNSARGMKSNYGSFCPAETSAATYCELMMKNVDDGKRKNIAGRLLTASATTDRCRLVTTPEKTFSPISLYSLNAVDKADLLEVKTMADAYYADTKPIVAFNAKDITGQDPTTIYKKDGEIAKKVKSEKFAIWQGSTPTSPLIHGRLSLIQTTNSPAYVHRSFADYILFDKKGLGVGAAMATDEKPNCQPTVTKLSCTATIAAKYKDVDGLRVRAVIKDSKDKIVAEETRKDKGQEVATSLTLQKVDPAKPDGEEYTCVASLVYRITTSTVKQVEFAKVPLDATKCKCDGNADPCGLKKDTTTDSSNSDGSGTDDGSGSKTNTIIIGVVSSIVGVIAIVIIGGIVYYFCFFKKKQAAKEANPAAQDLALQDVIAEAQARRGKEAALAALVARMHAKQLDCIGTGSIQAYRVAASSGLESSVEFTSVDSIIREQWKLLATEKATLTAAKIETGEWGYLMQLCRWPREPLVRKTAVSSIDGTPPLMCQDPKTRPPTSVYKCIHANFVRDIYSRYRFIASQAPSNDEFDVAAAIWKKQNVKLIIAIGTEEEISREDYLVNPKCKVNDYFRLADKGTHRFGPLSSIEMVKKVLSNDDMEVRKFHIYSNTGGADVPAGGKTGQTETSSNVMPGVGRRRGTGGTTGTTGTGGSSTPHTGKTITSGSRKGTPEQLGAGISITETSRKNAGMEAETDADTQDGQEDDLVTSMLVPDPEDFDDDQPSTSGTNWMNLPGPSGTSGTGGSSASGISRPETPEPMESGDVTETSREAAGMDALTAQTAQSDANTQLTGQDDDLIVPMAPPPRLEEFGGRQPSTSGNLGRNSSGRVGKASAVKIGKQEDDRIVPKMAAKPDGQTKHTLFHFLYKKWADRTGHSTQARHIVKIHSVIEENEELQTQLRDPKAKILVHCSAGQGRTGTLLLSFNVLALCKENIDPINLVVLLQDMREDRYGSVQNIDQLKTVVQAIGLLKDSRDRQLARELEGSRMESVRPSLN